MLEFKGEQLLETSSINFWSHHFDLALLLFSGNLIPDKDPEDWDNSREQMNFGFSFGDEGVAEPYIYITAYPFNEELLKHKLPSNAYWNKEGWNGAILKYSDVQRANKPKDDILDFMNTIRKLVF